MTGSPRKHTEISPEKEPDSIQTVRLPAALAEELRLRKAKTRESFQSFVKRLIEAELSRTTESEKSQNYDNPSSISPEQKTLDASVESLIQSYALAIGQIAEKAGEILELARVAGGHGNSNQGTDRGTRIARELTARAAESLRRAGRGKGNQGGTAPAKSATAPAAGGSGEKKAG